MVSTTGWLTSSYEFIERVLLLCNDLIKKLIRLCTTQNEQNTLLQAQNTTLNAENAALNSENLVLKSRIVELEVWTVSSVPTDCIMPVPSVRIEGAAPAADVNPVPTDGAPLAADVAAAVRKALHTRILYAAGSKTKAPTSRQRLVHDSGHCSAPQYAWHTEIYAP